VTGPRTTVLQRSLGTTPREIIAPDPQRSFRCVMHDFPCDVCGWAAHPEYEIHLIQRSTGSLIVGDYVGTFVAGHVSMIGPMLPHDWTSDLEPGQIIPDRDVLVQFTEEWIRACMRLMPELQRLDTLLSRSSRGLEFTGETAERAAGTLLRLHASSGPEQIGLMFALLGALADAAPGESRLLASQWLGSNPDPTANQAVEAGLTYIFDNLTGDVRMSTAARLAHMSEATFSKYFTRAAGMTFSDMVTRLRIAHARRLLDTTDMSVAQVAVASGYRNLSNFNRRFLVEAAMTPSAYRRLAQADKPSAGPGRVGLAAHPTQP
jgi:AraC-like DNA-binding protein